jgi:hypothetical protein
MQPTLDYPLQDKSPVNTQNVEDLTWNPVKSKNNKKNTKTSQPKQVVETQISVDNRFQTLDLNVNQDCVPSAVNKPQASQDEVTNILENIPIPLKKENKKNYNSYSKIPTIINRIVRHSEKQTSAT